MQHTEADQTLAVERYLLGDMTSSEMEQLEEHLFLCPECADSVKTGAMFVENARAVFKEPAMQAGPELIRQPVRSKPRSWWKIFMAPAFAAALAALVLHQSAYIADVTAAGLRSVGRGQFDAGLSLGLKRWQVYRRIILPQTVRVMLPPMTSQYVSVIKNTSVVALIGVADLTFQTQQINVETFRGFEAATAATLLYMLVAGAVIGAMTRLQRRQTAMP